MWVESAIRDRVPVAPFKFRFLNLEARGLISRSALARELGLFRWVPGGVSDVPDAGRAARILGLSPSHMQHTVPYEVAVRLCAALDLDPVDVDI